MAACELKIVLDDPATLRTDGAPVSGTVIVTTTAPVKCNALEVTTRWSTHGMGNIDQGDVDACVAFEGEWDADREYRYPFTLKTAAWPPTYYGNFLNVGHYVQARAKVSWSSDPKVQIEFPVAAASAPEDLKPTEPLTAKRNSLIGWIIGIVLLLIFLPLFGMLFVFLIPILAIGGAVYWFTRVYLPRCVTGLVECSVTPARVMAGEAVQGQLRFTPKRDANINGISWKVKCSEKCVSGSGSNKKTHHHELLNKTEQLAEAGPLRAGQVQAFEFTFTIPPKSPPSLKFSDNELIWQGELRIDIPRWPDWVKEFPLTVVPSATEAATIATLPAFGAGVDATGPPLTPEEETWFDEVAQQITDSEFDPDRLRMVLAAVQDQVFGIRVDVLEQMTEPPESASNESGTWTLARYRRRDLELALLWPAGGGPPADGSFLWCGRATMLGFDEDSECLLMRVV
ncbi:MAG: hypothetical protein ABI614_26435 [Planctomycetota bacterium]